jgi:hypothetical protein
MEALLTPGRTEPSAKRYVQRTGKKIRLQRNLCANVFSRSALSLRTHAGPSVAHRQRRSAQILCSSRLAAEKEHAMGAFIVAAVAIPAIIIALLHIRSLRHVAWLKTRMGMA